jgi:hypothetical protein
VPGDTGDTGEVAGAVGARPAGVAVDGATVVEAVAPLLAVVAGAELTGAVRGSTGPSSAGTISGIGTGPVVPVRTARTEAGATWEPAAGRSTASGSTDGR